MSDGSRLHDSWLAALKHAQSRFRALLAASASDQWKRIPVPTSSVDGSSGGANGVPQTNSRKALPRASDVIVHRRSGKGDDVIRVVLDIPADEGLESLESWKAVLTTPELRKEWDPTVDAAHIVETCFDPGTRISKTNFTLGWPANPRDAITISRTFTDATTLIDISTSLPRSSDEPAYLRPAPPYVRSHVHLFAWCIQLIPPPVESSSKYSPSSRLRITCFWQHDLKAIWGTAKLSQNLPSMVIGLIRGVRKRGNRIPTLSGWGNGVGIDNVAFNVGRDALRLDYSIFPEESSSDYGIRSGNESVDVRAFKERKRLERSVEVVLPVSHGWDIQVTTRAPSEETSKLPWTAYATRIATFLPVKPPDPSRPSTPSSYPSTQSQPLSSTSPSLSHYVVFRLVHSRPQEHAILKVKVVIELSGGSNGLRVNGSPHPIQDAESRDPVSFSMSKEMMEDTSSISGLSFQTVSTTNSQSSSTTQGGGSPMVRASSDRSPQAEKAILSLVRRNYIYFTSLLQEPEAKWRHVNESRGVTISQLDSIDPTLVVYRAEAVFVGIGVWDLLSIVKTPGTKIYWDRGFDDAVLLEDVNELTELWHHTTKAAWPVNARDTVLLSTSYKSPTAVHVFAFSTDDKHLFRSIPTSDPAVIRSQVDLQGWAIEALSPNTTLLTLLDQSDPKGWSNKSSIPQQMVAALAGVGEFAIKVGGPPVATRFGGAKVISMRYDHDKSTFKVEYEGSESRRHSLISANDMLSASPEESVMDLTAISIARPPPVTSSAAAAPATTMPRVECEIRCDVETWSTMLELVVDPPPQAVSCLKRHRLSSGGGGLWITVEHDAVFVGDDRIMAIVRKGSGAGPKDKGTVIVNGLRIKVDVEDLPEAEVKTLTKQKRVKPVRIPLDQPPVLGVIRRRRVEWDEEADSDVGGGGGGSGLVNGSSKSEGTTKDGSGLPSSQPSYTSPLRSFFTAAVDQTVSTTVAAANVFTPASYVNSPLAPSSTATTTSSASGLPMQRAFHVLEYLQTRYGQRATEDWSLVSDKGIQVHKRMEPAFSAAIAIHRADKVIEGISAGEVGAALVSYDCQKLWDDRFVSSTPLEEYGYGCSTAFLVKRSGFPFRDRGFWTAMVVAGLTKKSEGVLDSNDVTATSETQSKSSLPPYSPTIFIASTSFDPSSCPSSFSPDKVNPLICPIGHLVMSGWILEAVDPYQDEHNHPIPSTRCTHFVGVDYRGSVPVAFNNTMNAMLPKSEIVALEAWLKTKAGIGAGPLIRVPAPSLSVDPISLKAVKGAPGGDTEKAPPSEVQWTLDCVDEGRALVSTAFDSVENVWSATITLKPALLAETPRDDDFLAQRGLVISQARQVPSMASSTESSRLGRSGRLSPSLGSASTTATQASLDSSSSSITLRGRRQSGSGTPVRPFLPGHQRYPSSPHVSLPNSPHKGAVLDRARTMSSSGNDVVIPGSDRLVVDDPVIAEIAVNPALYPHGYAVDVSSATMSSTKVLDKAVPVSSLSLLALPFSATVYTIPPSPLLSMASDTPASRHLLSVTFPVAQFYAPVIVDPLTGENRMPPTKPAWLSDFEKEGAVVSICVTGNPTRTGPATTKDAGYKTTFNGKDLTVISERRSVGSVGREYLEADGAHCMPLLKSSPSSNEASDPPIALAEPLARDVSLLADPKPPTVVAESILPVVASGPELSKEVLATPETINDPMHAAGPARSSSGFFNFWNASSSFLGLGPPSAPIPSPTIGTSGDPEKQNGELSRSPDSVEPVPSSDGQAEPTPVPTDTVVATTRPAFMHNTYRFTTVLIIALIAFLFGSLVRSLASPADFIYFTSTTANDEGLARASNPGLGDWREVRRLLEFKRGLFGWDVVIAVVRRRQ